MEDKRKEKEMCAPGPFGRALSLPGSGYLRRWEKQKQVKHV